MKKIKLYQASQGQIARIHIAKKQLNIDEEAYRLQLAEYNNLWDGGQVKHSNQLTSFQADDLLIKYKASGWAEKEGNKQNNKWSRNKGTLKYEELSNRTGEWPTPGQLRLIEYKWRQCSTEKSDVALMKFLQHKYSIADLTWVKADQVKRIIKSIESLA